LSDSSIEPNLQLDTIHRHWTQFQADLGHVFGDRAEGFNDNLKTLLFELWCQAFKSGTAEQSQFGSLAFRSEVVHVLSESLMTDHGLWKEGDVIATENPYAPVVTKQSLAADITDLYKSGRDPLVSAINPLNSNSDLIPVMMNEHTGQLVGIDLCTRKTLTIMVETVSLMASGKGTWDFPQSVEASNILAIHRNGIKVEEEIQYHRLSGTVTSITLFNDEYSPAVYVTAMIQRLEKGYF
jgi:hypothetical protein